MAGLWGINSSGQATKANSFPVTLASDEDAQDLTIGGVPPQLDDTDKIAVSLYAGASGGAAGDTGLKTIANNVSASTLQELVTAAVLQAVNTSGVPQPLFGRPHSADAITAGNFGLDSISFQMLLNGNAWDRQRNNEEVTLLASAARTATTDSANQVNYNARGMVIGVDITLDPAAASITPQLRLLDPVSGAVSIIWTAAAPLASTGYLTYLFYPGAPAAASWKEVVSLALPRGWRFRMTHADADSITYSVSVSYIL